MSSRNPKPPLVNFLIAGAQKSGTSALASFLEQHPEICMAPKKELHFFDAPDYNDSDPSYADYERAFTHYNGEPLVGEATPIYMYWPFIARRIKAYNPAMKLICLLRDPAERAISHYFMEKSRGMESLPLWLALLLEPVRLRRHGGDYSLGSPLRYHSYRDRGYYVRQIKNLAAHFSNEQLLLLRTEDLACRHEATLARVYRFLGVADDFIPAPERVFAGSYRDGRAGAAARWVLDRFYHAERQLLASRPADDDESVPAPLVR